MKNQWAGMEAGPYGCMQEFVGAAPRVRPMRVREILNSRAGMEAGPYGCVKEFIGAGLLVMSEAEGCARPGHD